MHGAKKIGVVLLTSLALIGCGGGSNSRSNAPPALGAVADTTISANQASDPIDISITDEAPDQVTLEISSDNQTLLPTSAFQLLGSAADRTLTITPAGGELGQANVTIIATDARGLTTQTSFAITVQTQVVSFRSQFRTVFSADENAMPADVNSRRFTQDADNDDFSDLLANP